MENFNYMLFTARIRKYLKDIPDSSEQKTSLKIYNICKTHYTNIHIERLHKQLLIQDDITENYPSLEGKKIYQIFHDSFDIDRDLDKIGIQVSKELAILYDFLTRTQKTSTVPNFEELNNIAKLNIKDKAEKNNFSEGLTNQLVKNSDFVVYLERNIENINKNSTIDPDIVAREINKHIKSLLQKFKGVSKSWREELFQNVYESWENYFHDHKYQHVDKLLVFFFEKCSIFTDTIEMDDSKISRS